MEHSFIQDEKKVNGQVQTAFDASAGQAVVVGWDIPPENIPRFQPGKCLVTFKAAESVFIPSIWKAFGASANAGINSLVNKLGSALGGMSPTADGVSTDCHQPFKPVEVHTGIKVEMPRDEILTLSAAPNCYKNGILLVGNTVLDCDRANDEISLWFYNILYTDVTIQRGDDIAIGYFSKAVGAMINPQQFEPNYGRPTPINTVNLNK